MIEQIFKKPNITFPVQITEGFEIMSIELRADENLEEESEYEVSCLIECFYEITCQPIMIDFNWTKAGDSEIESIGFFDESDVKELKFINSLTKKISSVVELFIEDALDFHHLHNVKIEFEKENDEDFYYAKRMRLFEIKSGDFINYVSALSKDEAEIIYNRMRGSYLSLGMVLPEEIDYIKYKCDVLSML